MAETKNVMDVFFLRGTWAEFQASTKITDKVFAFITEGTDDAGKNHAGELYLGRTLLSNEITAKQFEEFKTSIEGRVKGLEDWKTSFLESYAADLNAQDLRDDGQDELIAELRKELDAITEVGGEPNKVNDVYVNNASVVGEDKIARIDLTPYAKTAELVDYSITVSTESVEDTYAKHYVFTQCGKEVAHIDIPKDLVVSSGSVETVVTENTPYEGAKVGDKYIKLVIANQEAPLYIPANSLVDVYTGSVGTEITVTIDSNNAIQASLDATVAANITKGAEAHAWGDHSAQGYAKDADLKALAKKDTVATADIDDKAVTKAKLEDSVQASLNLADSALQKADITEGTENGTISVEGANVAVHGLGSAAYTNSDAYATSAQGEKADSALQKADITEGNANGTIKVKDTEVAVHGLGSAAYTNSDAYDAAGAAAAVQGATTATVADVVKAINTISDDAAANNAETVAISNNVQNIVAQLTWGSF